MPEEAATEAAPATTSTTASLASTTAPRGGLDELLAHANDLKAVFCDLDGTFFNEKHHVPDGADEIIDRLQATGVRFVPTTGRTLSALHEMFGPIIDRLDVIASNGLDVIVDGQCLRHVLCPVEDARALLDAVCESDLRLGLIVFGMDTTYLMDVEADYARSEVESLQHAEVRPISAGIADEPICKVALAARDNAAVACQEFAKVLGDRFDFAPCGDHWIDVLVKGYDKINGIRLVMDALDATPDEVLAFGDSMNDYGMMCALPHSVAMGNAMPELKACCAYEIGTNVDGAVLDCLSRIADVREI